MIKRLYFFVGLLAFVVADAYGQEAVSPFTSKGLGYQSGMGLIQNESMGGLGIGSGSYWNLNNINPSLLLSGKNTIFGELTVFQTGITSESRTIRNPEKAEISQGSGLDYLVTGFPVVRNKWFASLGLKPYAVSNYNLNYTLPISGSTYQSYISETGKGGINQFFVSNGVALTKNINIGLTTQFLFGSKEEEFSSAVGTEGDPPGYFSTVYQRSVINGVLLRGGISYMDSIRIKNDEFLKVTFGAIYDFNRKLKGIQFESLRTIKFNGAIIESDTLVNNVEGDVIIPSGFGVGFSISKGFKWMVGLDAGVKNDENLVVFGESKASRKTTYIRLGTEITPDAFTVDNYFQRMTYRFGARYQKLPYLINGMEINDFGINFGVSLPIVPSAGSNAVLNKGFSSVDLSIGFGKQGNVESHLLEEEYIKFKFGITFNDKWFVKRKFN